MTGCENADVVSTRLDQLLSALPADLQRSGDQQTDTRHSKRALIIDGHSLQFALTPMVETETERQREEQ